MKGDEVVGADERAHVQLAMQATDRSQCEDAIAAGVLQRPHVGDVVDAMRLNVRVAVARDEDRIADAEPLDAIAARDTQASHQSASASMPGSELTYAGVIGFRRSLKRRSLPAAAAKRRMSSLRSSLGSITASITSSEARWRMSISAAYSSLFCRTNSSRSAGSSIAWTWL